MRKILLILIVLSSLSLFGCKKKDPILLGPKNVLFGSSANTLTWTEDEKAIGYVVLFNGKEISVSNNSFDLSSYAPGQYTVRVRTIYENKTSNYTPELKIYLMGKLNIYIKGSKIYVTEIENASYKYVLRVDHIKVEGTTDVGVIDIPGNFLDRVINFNLKVYIGNEIMEGVEMEISLIINNAFKDRDLEILVENPRVVYIDGEEIEATLLTDRVIIPKEKVASLESEVILSVSGDTHIIKKLYVTDPFVELTSPQVINETDELKFTFDLNNFTFTGIAKEEFTLGVDYFFNEGILTFSDEFVSKYQGLFPESENIYLMAVFKRGTETVLINITITLGA